MGNLGLILQENTGDGGVRRWFALRINPEPWRVGPVTPGRRGGKIFATIGRDQQLAAFQDAVAEELGTSNYLVVGPVKLRFWFWRNRAEYTTQNARQHRKHDADVTNLQKAMEDALQSILFENDKQVNDVQSVLVHQGPDIEPLIIFSIEGSSEPPMAVHSIDPRVYVAALEAVQKVEQADNSWPPRRGV